jgi:hypothetical protein
MSGPFKSRLQPTSHVQISGPKYDSDKMAASLKMIAENFEKRMQETFQTLQFSQYVAAYEAGYAQALMDHKIKQE